MENLEPLAVVVTTMLKIVLELLEEDFATRYVAMEQLEAVRITKHAERAMLL